jgi:hypothetical protein
MEGGYYYVDKTLFIKDLLDKGAEVTLCTRPRRFGKTLNQTMLKCFFEDTTPFGGKDTRSLFRGLKIEAAGDGYMEHQGKYPVIFLSLKEAESDNYDETCDFFRAMIAAEFRRHEYVKEKITHKVELDGFEKLAAGKADIPAYKHSLKFLSRCLEDYHGVKTIILIDEYDVPLQRSWICGYYKEMMSFIRPLLSSALKDNSHLQFAVVTGCLRISRESIFTGLNNPEMISILTKNFSEYFGFTQAEMDIMLEHYGLTSKREAVRDWYDGYLFGNTEVYNPWSSIHVVKNWLTDIDELPKPYWSNTSGNEIVRELINRADRETKTELETLMTGGTISKLIHEDITYDEIYQSNENLWNFLFFTGYLKKVGETADYKGRIVVEMKIPNRELDIIFENKVQEWFHHRISEKNLDTFFNAILAGDTETFQTELESLLRSSISFMDNAENFYHGFMAGILSRLDGYCVKSNRESGHGRSDVVLYADNGKAEKAIIFELKMSKTFKQLPEACDEALAQIEKNNYASEWEDEGYTDIMKYGVAFYKKRCLVKT